MIDYEPFLIEVDQDDAVFIEAVIKRVDPYGDGEGWSVTRDDGFGCGVPRLTHSGYGGEAQWTSPAPAVGDTMRIYGRFGSVIHGITLNGRVVFYRNAELQEQYRRRQLENSKASAARQFTISRVEMDANYGRLLPVFQRRIDRFRAEKPDFRRDDEVYEVFCLLQAQAVADHYAAMGGLAQLEADRGADMEGFGDLWDLLTKAGVVSDAHSNNTFGAALRFARALLDGSHSEQEATP